MSEENALPTNLSELEHGLGIKTPAPIEPTSIDAWYDDFEKPILHTLPSGRTIEIVHLDLVSEILAGTLPNFVLDHVVFGRDLLSEAIMDNNNATKVKEYVEGLINIACRAVKNPVVRHPSDGKPRRERGEVPPSVFTLQELQDIRFVALYDQLPSVKESPFRPGEDAGGESGEPGQGGESVQDDPIGIPGDQEGQPDHAVLVMGTG